MSRHVGAVRRALAPDAPAGPWRLPLAAGADRAGLADGAGRRVPWKGLDSSMPQLLSVARRVLTRPWPGLRRLDRAAAVLSLAVEALELPARLPEATRRSTAIVLGTVHGCLDSDWRFDQGRGRAVGPPPQLFAYTLPSTCLGDLAGRHRLMGPSLCLSLPRDGERRAFVEAARLIQSGDASTALVCLGDWLTPEAAGATGVPAPSAFVAALLEPGVPRADDPLRWSDLMERDEPVAGLVERLRHTGPQRREGAGGAPAPRPRDAGHSPRVVPT